MPKQNVSDDLDAWVLACRRDAGLTSEGVPKPKPKRRIDGRRYEDGSGPRRRPWGESGAKYACPTPAGRFAARMRFAGKLHYCGTFDTAPEAEAAAAAKLKELSG